VNTSAAEPKPAAAGSADSYPYDQRPKPLAAAGDPNLDPPPF
jgi:hypothetical protein